MRAEPLSVSVIVPVYNGEAFLAEAVASISRQAVKPLEILIVDDGSTDGTAKVAASLRADIGYVFQENSGAAAARSRGLSLASGDVIGFLDADDLWSDGKLEIQLAHLAENSTTGIVLGHTQFFRRSATVGPESGYEKHSTPWLALSFGAALFRRSAFERVGIPDERFAYDDDVDWFLRAKELGVPMRIHPEVTLLYRRHAGNMTNQRDTDRHYFMTALKRSLDRRRTGERAPARPLEKWYDGPT